MKTRRPKQAMTAALLMGTVLYAGAAGAQSKPQVIIGYEDNGADPYMVSMAEHLFERHMNADVEYKLFSSGPAAMSALASNSLSFMCGLGVPPLVTAIAQGLPMTIVYNQERYTNAAGIVVKSDSGIRDVAGLQGKKIAIVAGSQASFELATFLAEAHVPYTSVTQINMAPPQMRTSWVTGSIDAAIVWDPVFSALRAAGGKAIKTDGDLPRSASSYNVCIANADWAKAHPDLVRGFVAALDEGYQITKKDPDKAIAEMARQTGVTVDVAKSELAGYELFSGADQTTPNVMGSGAGVKTSATYETLVNTAKVLNSIGRIQTVPSSFEVNVAPQYSQSLAH
ncbi:MULTISPECIES: ABC transporter substrate-binding protein [unclassified Caballeronia]|uniref:taurine ABC transporter substrate-binding protein n=1 Tax=unclassified Caballeronia TaxID=2646786 RepID=UPI0028644F3B|nr:MULTISPECIES: ABC transporter substrate-binding protein [unclassified Caballeronia]MDR5813443.1 ABC transporter substrate-binding protein [Caballeronia sp. LZ033]MDR5820201.1 ABC transporter substrate-binding protein [Caballeronia sp. LZ043]